ncbi:MAG: non-homologous end-joining DNA ligase [Spirochaetia bacterium]|jgi:bifunctional non-homologous end joining protein LigD
MPTEEYSRKRDFKRTPEPGPAPDAGPAKGDVFVVHRHEARNLHYDLRIQADGVLACWAVPRGFSYFPGDKRLAVRTEDHPFNYKDFEGAIPKGQYGAGTMKIWDAGKYVLRKSPAISRALEKGELKLELMGRRLRGEWHLVRTKGAEGRNWLLFKARDRYAGSGSDLFGGADMSRALLKPMSLRVSRMEPVAGFKPFSDPEWLFEPALVGRRVLASIDDSQVSLRARSGDLAPLLPVIASHLGRLRAQRALLDGVIVALDRKGAPSDAELDERLRDGGKGCVLYLFDALYAEDWDLRRLPLAERRLVLRALLPESDTLLLVDAVVERGEMLARAAAGSGFPAVIAKRCSSPYRPGASDDWRKIALRRTVRSAAGRRAGAVVRVTNPRKVYWPEQGFTKQDLVAYYDRAASWLLPHLTERPLHLYRWPDGIRGKAFYQKQLPEGAPDWIETTNVAREGAEPSFYAVCNDRRTLLTLVNLGTIDLHPWLSRRGSLDSPDWAILDLDPKEAPFSNVVKVARIFGKLLRGIGIEPCLKTSGSTGLHVCIPLKPGFTYDQSRMFCEALARVVVREHPDLATVDRAVSRRAGRVYIDFLQNRREQTVVPPYVVRPVEAASVSMPLSWDELEGDLQIGDFTILTAPARVEKMGDLFRTALRQPQDLTRAIRALSRQL